jgi:hypothetical protein
MKWRETKASELDDDDDVREAEAQSFRQSFEKSLTTPSCVLSCAAWNIRRAF